MVIIAVVIMARWCRPLGIPEIFLSFFVVPETIREDAWLQVRGRKALLGDNWRNDFIYCEYGINVEIL